MTIGDYEQLVRLWTRAGLPFRSRGRDSKQAMKAQMNAGQVFFLGAFEDHHLLGAVVASWDGRKGWINRLAVDPEYRRRGIARTLVAEAETLLRERGARVFSALVEDSNEASRRLLKRCGYEEIEEIRYFSKRDSKEA